MDTHTGWSTLALARLDTDQVPSILRAVDAAAG
jgi:hypothetical protein